MAGSEQSMGPLVNELFAKDLIDAAQHGVAMNGIQPALDRATGLLSSVLVRRQGICFFYIVMSSQFNRLTGNISFEYTNPSS